MKKAYALQAVLVAAVFAADRAAKIWALERLKDNQPIEVFRWFRFSFVENTGAAFGMLRDSNLFFIFLTIALIAVLLFFKPKIEAAGQLSSLAILLVLGGAAGNLFDRFCYGAVIDFLDFRVWPVFNVADSCITVGGVLIAVDSMRGPAQAAAEK